MDTTLNIHRPYIVQIKSLTFEQTGPHQGDVDTVKQMVKAYMMVVAKTIQDIVPKYIVYLLVENVSFG